MLQVGISTRLWAEHDHSACWILVQPAEGSSPAVLEKLKLGSSTRRIDKDGQIAIPIPTKDILKTTGALLDQITRWARSLPVAAAEPAAPEVTEGAR